MEKNGIDLIKEERESHLKHGFDGAWDITENSGIERPLTKAAAALTIEKGAKLAAETMKPGTLKFGTR